LTKPRRSTVRSCTFLQWSKTMTRKTYIGTPHRDSVSGQSLVTVCDGQKSEPLPLRLDLFKPQQKPVGEMPMLWATMTARFSLHQDFKFKVVACWPEGERWLWWKRTGSAGGRVTTSKSRPTK
jgi:hypothetical protein